MYLWILFCLAKMKYCTLFKFYLIVSSKPNWTNVFSFLHVEHIRHCYNFNHRFMAWLISPFIISVYTEINLRNFVHFILKALMLYELHGFPTFSEFIPIFTSSTDKLSRISFILFSIQNIWDKCAHWAFHIVP